MLLNRRARSLAVLGSVAMTSVLWSACNGKVETEYVAGFSAQVSVPRDLQSVIIRVDVNGQNTFAQNFPVYDGKVRLPRTLGVAQASSPPGTPVTISVWGFDVPDTNAGYSAFSNPLAKPEVGTWRGTPANNGGARILRASRQPYVQDQILYLPMPFHYSCYDVDCAAMSNPGNPACGDDNCTCKAGLCVPPDVDTSTLPPYNDGLIYGTTNTCFRPFSDVSADGTTLPGCMDPLQTIVPGNLALAPQVIDQAHCIFALPGLVERSGRRRGVHDVAPRLSPPRSCKGTVGPGSTSASSSTTSFRKSSTTRGPARRPGLPERGRLRRRGTAPTPTRRRSSGSRRDSAIS